jgi:hypothetical protein
LKRVVLGCAIDTLFFADCVDFDLYKCIFHGIGRGSKFQKPARPWLRSLPQLVRGAKRWTYDTVSRQYWKGAETLQARTVLTVLPADSMVNYCLYRPSWGFKMSYSVAKFQCKRPRISTLVVSLTGPFDSGWL